MDFAEVRPYQIGDDVRSIDWRITARVGKPHTKLYIEERECPVMLAVDLSSTMQMGTRLLYKSVQAAHIASLICWLTMAQKDRIGAVVVGDQSIKDCPPTARRQGPLQVLNAIRNAHIERGEEKPNQFLHGMNQLYRLCPKGSEVIVVSDFSRLCPQVEKRLKQIAEHNYLRLIQVFDPIEQGETDFRGRFWLSDNRNAQRVSFGRGETRGALQDSFAKHHLQLQTLARQLKAPLYQVTAAKSLLEQLGGMRE